MISCFRGRSVCLETRCQARYADAIMPAIVRSAALSDLPALTAIYNHYVAHSAITFDLQPFQPEERLAWFGDHSSSGRHRLLVAAHEDGSLLGYATTSRWRPKAAYDTTVESTVYCRPDAVGQGIGSALYSRAARVDCGRRHPSGRGWSQPAESRVRRASSPIRLPAGWGVLERRTEVWKVLGCRLVRAADDRLIDCGSSQRVAISGSAFSNRAGLFFVSSSQRVLRPRCLVLRPSSRPLSFVLDPLRGPRTMDHRTDQAQRTKHQGQH